MKIRAIHASEVEAARQLLLASGWHRRIQGDKTLQVVRCKTCGCTTHWEPLDPLRHNRLGVNIRRVGFGIAFAPECGKQRAAWAVAPDSR